MAFEIALRTIGAITCLVITVLCGWSTYKVAKDAKSPSHAIGAVVGFCMTVAAAIAIAACAFYNI